jgi:pimeloyl-ACP methyl ester carboxylesterase
VQLGAVKTWYDEHGQGEPLVLMHGGLVDARFFEPNLPALAEHFHVSTPERRGHGHIPDVEGPITEFLGAAYGEVSPDGEDHFPVVATKVGEMVAVEPTLQASELARVTCRSLEMFADDDLVMAQHMIDMYAALPNAELAIVPGTSHFLTQEKPELVNKIVVDFLTKEPVATVAPIRRAPKPEVSPG